MSKGQGCRPREEMRRVYEIVDQRITEGLLSNEQISEEAGCSTRTVWLRRKKWNQEVADERTLV